MKITKFDIVVLSVILIFSTFWLYNSINYGIEIFIDKKTIMLYKIIFCLQPVITFTLILVILRNNIVKIKELENKIKKLDDRVKINDMKRY
jgi:hypothetical protein